MIPGSITRAPTNHHHYHHRRVRNYAAALSKLPPAALRL
jgi:hypothetical protein